MVDDEALVVLVEDRGVHAAGLDFELVKNMWEIYGFIGSFEKMSTFLGGNFHSDLFGIFTSKNWRTGPI